MDDVGSIVEPTSSLAWADIICADFQRVISRYIQNISIWLSCEAQRGLRTIFIQKSMSKYACLIIKIDEVWIEWFCIHYDWCRRLQPTSSVSPVCIWGEMDHAVHCIHKITHFKITYLFKLMSGYTYMHQWTYSSLAQLMAQCQISTKPLPVPLMNWYQWDPRTQMKCIGKQSVIWI